MNRHSIAFVLLGLIATATGGKTSISVHELDPSREWQDIPWPLRYVLFVNSEKNMKDDVLASKRFNALDGKQGKDYVYHDIEELFAGTLTVVASKTIDIGTAVILFDQSGRVLNKDPIFERYIGKLSGIERFVLVSPDKLEAKPYGFGRWDQGIPGDVSFSPALCTTLDSHRYASHWKRNDYRGNVGCREWTAQLYRREQPYIDVTTYSKRGNFIGELVGWARFEDRPRPVIGMQGKQWLCLHECPAGEKPGVIPDIRAWTLKHNFPMPERPARQPVYPNANYKDDLNEFWQDE
jgi:hypothetical protein